MTHFAVNVLRLQENLLKHADLRRYFRHGTLTQLAVFEAVARHQSFTRAGEELCLAQPTVSVQMKKLAQTIGVPLFTQKGRQMALTEAGQELNATLGSVFEQLSQLESRLCSIRPVDTGFSRHDKGELRKIGGRA